MPTALDATARQPECYSNADASWIVATTHPQAERWAESNLTRAGYRTYLPLYAARTRDRVTHSMTHITERPLFPGYLFVAWQQPESWSPIKAAPGVKSLVGTNGRPDMVRPGTVEALQAGDDARRTIPPPGALWAAGDPCTPAHGPFHGLPAAVVAVEDEIATIAVMMLGQLRRVQIPVEHLIRRDND
jgi:transcription antitermination factor NusG